MSKSEPLATSTRQTSGSRASWRWIRERSGHEFAQLAAAAFRGALEIRRRPLEGKRFAIMIAWGIIVFAQWPKPQTLNWIVLEIAQTEVPVLEANTAHRSAAAASERGGSSRDSTTISREFQQRGFPLAIVFELPSQVRLISPRKSRAERARRPSSERERRLWF